MAIKYKDFEKREQLRKDYIDKAAEAAKTQANAYTDEQIRNIPAPPAPDIPTALPQKYEAFKVQLVQGDVSEGDDPMWSEYHETLWSGSEVLTNNSATTKAHFVTDTVLYWRSPRKYNLLITINGTEKEFVFEGEHSQYGTNWVIWQLKENDVVVAEAECIGADNGQRYNNTSTVDVYCPDGSPYIGQTMTLAHYGKKQYVYSLMNPAAILQYPSETENARFLTMCQSIATKNAKLKLTLTDNVIEANYANISNELVTTDYVNGDYRIRWIGVVADRKPLDNGGSYHDLHDDMPTCIKGVLEVEYTGEEATKECVYDKIQGESYTFKIGDFNHDEGSAFDYYFNGAILIPFDTAQIRANFTYRPVSGTEKRVQVKSLVNNGQMLPYFDISELFGQAANTVMATITSNTAVENADMGGRPVTTIALTSNVQNFTDANDEIMVGQILTLLTSPAGLKAEKYDGTKDGALVFDASGTAMVGDVVLDANGNIDAAQSDLQDLATRAKPSELTDGHLLKWDATNKKIVDGGTISSGGGVKGKRFTFTEENIVKLGNDVNFSMTTSQNYAVGATSSHTAVAADNRGMLQFEVGKSYKLQYGASVEAPTTVYAVASSMTLSDGTTVAKAEFTVNGKTLVVVDRATATANITSEASLTYSPNGAVAYFSDFSTVGEYLPIHLFTIPKEYYVRIPFDETILSTDIVAIFTDKIAPTSVTHTTSYIELNYGVSSSVYYKSDSASIHDYAKYLIGTDYYLAVVGSSTTGGAYVVSAKQENINERSTTVLVSEWVSETGGTFKWTDSGSADTSLIEYGVVWNSEVKLSFATETDKETFEAAGCKIVSGKTFATPLTITCTTKPTKPICFSYTVRNNAR